MATSSKMTSFLPSSLQRCYREAGKQKAKMHQCIFVISGTVVWHSRRLCNINWYVNIIILQYISNIRNKLVTACLTKTWELVRLESRSLGLNYFTVLISLQSMIHCPFIHNFHNISQNDFRNTYWWLFELGLTSHQRKLIILRKRGYTETLTSIYCRSGTLNKPPLTPMCY